MSSKNLGGFITKSPAIPSSSSASGIWTVDEAMQYTKANSWPRASGGFIPWGPMTLNAATDGNGVAYPGTQAQYAAVSTIPTGINYVFSSGYHYFDISAGTYSIDIRGAEGSGTNHGRGAKILATLVVLSATRLVAVVGNAGSGSYGGGGGTFLAMRNAASDVYTSATALLVAGGGGGGYSATNTSADAGITTDSSTTRRGTTTDRAYDGGAGFLASYNPEIYPSTTGGQGSAAAQHFVWGCRGGIETACGGINGNSGGFGGGGGTCPAGGGGYVGGYAGGNSPSAQGGGGGTSYRLASGATAYISAWSDNGYNGTINGTTGLLNGYLSINKVS